jgi:predicted secreted protein
MGWKWYVTETDPTFGYPEEEIMPGPDGSTSMDTLWLTWETTGYLPLVGQHSVSLAYARSLEDTDPVSTMSFTINILPAEDPIDPEPPGYLVVLVEEDNGMTVTVDQGTDIMLQLYADPSTGYEWTVVRTDPTFGYPASNEFIPDEEVESGEGGIQQMIWKTDGGPYPLEGGHYVSLNYWKAPDIGSIEDTFEFSVQIQGPAAAD